METVELLHRLDLRAEYGLSGAEVARRQAQYGPNAVASHRARPLRVLWHQLRSPLLGLLLTAAIALSHFVGERDDAVTITTTRRGSSRSGSGSSTSTGPRRPRKRWTSQRLRTRCEPSSNRATPHRQTAPK